MKNLIGQRPADVPTTSHNLVLWTSRNWVPQNSRGRLYLKLWNICFTKTYRNRYVRYRLLLPKCNFIIKLSIFSLVPKSSNIDLWSYELKGTFKKHPRHVGCQLGYDFHSILFYGAAKHPSKGKVNQSISHSFKVSYYSIQAEE